MRILVLDAHCDAALVCLRSLAKSGYETYLAGNSSDAYAWHSKYARDRYIYPNPLENRDAFLKSLQALDDKECFDIILPLTDSTIIPLAELDRANSLNAKAVLPKEDAFSWAFDKAKTMELAKRLAISMPESVVIGSPVWDWGKVNNYPVFVKPVQSKSWSKGEGRHLQPVLARNISELETFCKSYLHFGAVMIQEYVHGYGVGVEVLCDQGEIILSFAHKRIHELPLTGGGSSYRVSIAMPAALYSNAQKLLREIKWHGVAMVEFKRKGDQFWLMEINGRFWGSLPLAACAGVDFPSELIKMITMRRGVVDSNYREGIYARNIVKDYYWFRQNLVADKTDPFLLTRNVIQSAIEPLRIFIGKECLDSFSWQDPGPFLRQIRLLVVNEYNNIKQRISHYLALRQAG